MNSESRKSQQQHFMCYSVFDIILCRMCEKNEFRLCMPVDLTRRFKGLSIDSGEY